MTRETFDNLYSKPSASTSLRNLSQVLQPVHLDAGRPLRRAQLPFAANDTVSWQRHFRKPLHTGGSQLHPCMSVFAILNFHQARGAAAMRGQSAPLLRVMILPSQRANRG